jgi:tellurite resistance protein TerC
VSRSALRHLRRVIVAVIGLTVLAIGVAMIVLPGPATLVIPLGLGILAIEFAWAERMLKRLKDGGNRVLGRGRLQ